VAVLQVIDEEFVNRLRFFRILLQWKHSQEVFEVGVGLLSLGVTVEVEDLSESSTSVVGEGGLVFVFSAVGLADDESAGSEGLLGLSELASFHELRTES